MVKYDITILIVVYVWQNVLQKNYAEQHWDR